MNREIKFRAWDSINNKWLLGYEYPNLGGFSMMGEVMAFGEWQRVLAQFKIEDWDKIILMQYTGLKDKNGKEIYEGDVLRFPERVLEPCDLGTFDIFSIAFKDGSFVMDDYGEYLYGWNDDAEVIGNIYENPELSNSEPNVQECDASKAQSGN